MKDREKRINEMSRDMCFHTNCSVAGRCYELNCETTWLAEKLVNLNYQKINEDDIIISKKEYERLHSIEIAFEEFTKPDVTIIPTEEYEILKIKEKEKHWLNTCMSVWQNAKIDGSQEAAKNILNELECFLWETAINDTKYFDLYQSLYRSIKEHIKNKYGVTKEN